MEDLDLNRNYLHEAYLIAKGQTYMVPEREHLEAVIAQAEIYRDLLHMIEEELVGTKRAS